MMAGSSDYHIRMQGPDDKPGLILIHGFLGSSLDWLPVTRTIGNEYRFMLPDLPGHGQTPASDLPFESQIELLAETLECRQRTPSFLAGYSMGGRIALYLALRHPELFRKAIIISASPGLKTEKERQSRRESDALLATKIETNFRQFLKDWYNLPLFVTLKNHPSLYSVLRAREHNKPDRIAIALRTLGTGSQPSLWQELRNSQIPLTFFAGEKDLKYVEIGRQMVNLCPRINLEIFPECGHTLHIEKHALFIDRLLLSLTEESSL
jgi:2-succinyl-6-hydroxy-2,4-cyclohexadiene-1-carboxylate synthase